MSDTARKLDEARQRADRAQKRLDYIDNRTTIDDPGAVSGIRRKDSARQQRQKEAAWDLLIRAEYEARTTRTTVERLEAKLATEQREAAQDQGATVDLDRLRPGDHIRHRRHGHSEWELVVRVNAKTITCREHFAGHDKPKVPKDRVLETRHQEEA